MGQTTFSGPVAANNGFTAGSFTTAERNALTNVATGTLIFNSTDSEMQVYDGSAWISAFAGNGGAYIEGVDYSNNGTEVLAEGTDILFFYTNLWTNPAISTIVTLPVGTPFSLQYTVDPGTTYTGTLAGSWTATGNEHTVHVTWDGTAPVTMGSARVTQITI